jgi:hypothetical protein
VASWFPDLSVTLNWRDGLTIAAFLLAVDSYRRLRHEKIAWQDSRDQLMRQVAAHVFTGLAREGLDLENGLSQRDWDRSRDRADRFRLSLAEASGSWIELFANLEREKIDTATVQLAGLQSTLHSCGQNPPNEEQTVDLRQRCATVYTLLAEIAGKLRYLEPHNPSTRSRGGWLASMKPSKESKNK